MVQDFLTPQFSLKLHKDRATIFIEISDEAHLINPNKCEINPIFSAPSIIPVLKCISINPILRFSISRVKLKMNNSPSAVKAISYTRGVQIKICVIYERPRHRQTIYLYNHIGLIKKRDICYLSSLSPFQISLVHLEICTKWIQYPWGKHSLTKDFQIALFSPSAKVNHKST